MGAHTQSLLKWAQSNGQVWIRLDGPYGKYVLLPRSPSFAVPPIVPCLKPTHPSCSRPAFFPRSYNLNYRRYPVCVTMVAGIGVTPVLGMVRDLYDMGVPKDSAVLPNMVEGFYVIWSVPDEKNVLWFKEDFDRILANQAPGMPKLHLHIHVTRAKTLKEPSPGVFCGRPNLQQIVDSALVNYPGKAMALFTCGPKAIVESAWDVAATCNRAGKRVDFHHETFEF